MKAIDIVYLLSQLRLKALGHHLHLVYEKHCLRCLSIS